MIRASTPASVSAQSRLKLVGIKVVAATISLTLAGASVPSIVAAEIPTTKAGCEEAGMKWKKKTNKCVRWPKRSTPTPARLVVALIGIGSALVVLLFIGRAALAERRK